MRHHPVIISRIACGGIQRFMPALRAADKVEPRRPLSICFSDYGSCGIMGFLYRLLSEIQQCFIVHPEAAVEPGLALMAAVAAQRNVALLERRLAVGCLI